MGHPEELRLSENRELSDTLGSILQCDKEAIHLSGAIQGRGCLIVFDNKDFRIHNTSENTKNFLELDQNPLGSKLNHIFENSFVRTLEVAVSEYPWKSTGRHLEYQSLRQRFEIYLFETNGLFAVELEKVSAVSQRIVTREIIDRHLEEFTDDFRSPGTIEEVAKLVCHKVRKITGLDRVMMYRFVQPSFHGEVIAEDRIIEAHSFLGHRFPSSDIPKPARDLYLRNRVRWISNINEPISPVLPPVNILTQQKLDLSDSRLRSVSPIHLEYLKNMGVQCSMSFAVTVKGSLWGLVACHHMSDITVSQEQRLACEFVVNAFAGQGPLLESLSQERAHNQFITKLQQFLQSLLAAAKPLETLFRNHSKLNDLFGASGIAFVSSAKIDVAGITPLRADLKILASLLTKQMDELQQDVIVTSSFSVDFPEAFQEWSADPELQTMMSGVMAFRSPATQDGLFILFRPELIKTITWGGDPVKQLDKKNFQGPINPRQSFQAWSEIIRHSARPWKSYEIEGARTLKQFVFDTLLAR
jgi:chemotaxis family two-component system sensor kinase Cph1